MHIDLSDTWGGRREAFLYIKSAVESQKGIGSVLDIGAGDGKAEDAMPEGVAYGGIDIGADIYGRNPRVRYIENYAALRANIVASPPVDLVTLFDVLEHTADLTGLFKDGAGRCSKYLFVSLPNEMNLECRVRFLFGQPVSAHGLDLLAAKPGHKHQWMITYEQAKEVLVRKAASLGFELSHEVFIRELPRTGWKRLLVRLLQAALPVRLTGHGMAFVFARSRRQA